MDVHFLDLAVVLVLGLLVFGPKRLPELGSQLGRAVREFQQILRDDEPSAAPAAPPAPAAPVVASPEPTPAIPLAEEVVASETHQE